VTKDTFAIIAEFPLGTYRGHVGDGDLDEFPSVARLHAALLCAAVTGPMARLTDNGPELSEQATKALEWLEANPPDALCLPQLIRNESPGVLAYRKLGLLDTRQVPNKSAGAPESVDNKESSQDEKKTQSNIWVPKTLSRPANESMALAGTIAWIWENNPPADEEVRETLASLCPDVSHLGCAESPVRLRVGHATPTHRRDDNADLFRCSGINVFYPTRGRTTELMEIEDARRSGSSDPDGVTPPENEQRLPGQRHHIAEARFNTAEPPTRETPWHRVLLVPLDTEIPAESRVSWAVRAHRALIRLIGSGAPALLTGHYQEGVTPPANRVAIHILDKDALGKDLVADCAYHDSVRAVLAVMIPSGAATTDIECVINKTRQLSYLVGPGGNKANRVKDARIVEVDAQAFWPPVPPGHSRLWRTVPAAVPDSRPPCRKLWTIEDAIALSVALVFRDQMKLGPQPENWRVQLARAAKNKGVRAENIRIIAAGDPTRFVHHVNPGVVVRPYEAIIDLGDLGTPQGLLAIGQSRHLGGGLLYPIDIQDERLAKS